MDTENKLFISPRQRTGVRGSPRLRFFVVFLALLPSRTWAFFESGVDETLGSLNYVGTKAYANFGDNFNLTPTFSDYHSDISEGTYKTYSLRGAYDGKLGGIGITGGETPDVNGYSNHFFGVDGNFSLMPNIFPDDNSDYSDHALSSLNLGGALTETEHSESATFLKGTFFHPNPVFIRQRVNNNSAINIGETDANAFINSAIDQNLLSASVTKSVYSRPLSAAVLRSAAVLNSPGMGSIIQGFPNTQVNLKWIFPSIHLVSSEESEGLSFSPYLNYAHIVFALPEPMAEGYTVGFTLPISPFLINASYEYYSQPGLPGIPADQSYYSLQASFRIESLFAAKHEEKKEEPPIPDDVLVPE